MYVKYIETEATLIQLLQFDIMSSNMPSHDEIIISFPANVRLHSISSYNRQIHFNSEHSRIQALRHKDAVYFSLEQLETDDFPNVTNNLYGSHLK